MIGEIDTVDPSKEGQILLPRSNQIKISECMRSRKLQLQLKKARLLLQRVVNESTTTNSGISVLSHVQIECTADTTCFSPRPIAA